LDFSYLATTQTCDRLPPSPLLTGGEGLWFLSLNDHYSAITNSRITLHMTTLHALLQERYGTQTATEAPIHSSSSSIHQTLQTLETLLNHRSVRAYTHQTITQDTIDLLIAAAQSASTSSNLQAWSVILVQDSNRKETLATLAGHQQHVREAPLFMVWLADLSRFQRLAEHYHRTVEALPYLETFLVGCIDASLAAQNTLIAAESMGLGGVYIGGIRNHIDQVAEVLALPPSVFPVFGLALGYPDPHQHTDIKPRLPQSLVAFHEQYPSTFEDEYATTAQYDVALQHFQTKQNMPNHNWSELVLKRLRNVSALHGREKLKEELEKMGFPLK
jgi:nitroreductase